MAVKVTIETRHVFDDVISFNEDGSIAEKYTDCPLDLIINSAYVAIKSSKFFSYARCCEELYGAEFAIDGYDNGFVEFGNYISDYIVLKNTLINGVGVFTSLKDVLEDCEYCFTADASYARSYRDNVDNARMQLRQIDVEIKKLEKQRNEIAKGIERDKADYQIEVDHALESANDYMEKIKVAERIAAVGMIIDGQRGE